MSTIQNMENKEEMIELINSYSIEYESCDRACCADCDFLENCYYKARQAEDSEWAKSLDYAGYSNEEEFWEQLLS